MNRTAQAHWQGSLKEGIGSLSTPSGILNKTNYSFKTRFEDNLKGTNPEELLAAAHAGCFTMSVAAILTEKGHSPKSLETIATITLEGLTITKIHLSIKGSGPGISSEELKEVSKIAEKNCIISKALSVEITSEAHLID